MWHEDKAAHDKSRFKRELFVRARTFSTVDPTASLRRAGEAPLGTPQCRVTGSITLSRRRAWFYKDRSDRPKWQYNC